MEKKIKTNTKPPRHRNVIGTYSKEPVAGRFGGQDSNPAFVGIFIEWMLLLEIGAL